MYDDNEIFVFYWSEVYRRGAWRRRLPDLDAYDQTNDIADVHANDPAGARDKGDGHTGGVTGGAGRVASLES